MNTKLKGTMLGAMMATAAVWADPSVSELWQESLAAETNGNYAAALDIHEQILPKVGITYLASLRAGWLNYMIGRYPDALRFYEKASQQSSGTITPLYGAMNCHDALGDSARVIRVAKAILVINELDYTANRKLAETYYAEREFALAAAYYRKLNRLYPEDLAVASGLAWSCLEEGNARQAAPLFEDILMLSPDYPYAERGMQICKQIENR